MADRHNEERKIAREDWAIMALTAASDGKLTPVQIQKALFLLSQEASDKVGANFYHFVPYNYGPFSKEIYVDLDIFHSTNLVEARKDAFRDWPIYSITPAGRERGGALLSSVEPKLRDYLSEVVNWTKSLKFSELVGSIYSKYPAFKANSIFVER